MNMSVSISPATQADAVPTVENQPQHLLQGKYAWRIDNFSKLHKRKYCSDTFIIGGYKWRILIFPKGNIVDHLSMYLDVADSAVLPYGWSQFAYFNLAVLNHLDPKLSIRKDTQHQFTAHESDWGFTSFMSLHDLYDPAQGYLVNDTLILEADVNVQNMADYWAYASKKETGFVGLKNQGATCYMNSLLQSLYHIPYFRKAVYHMPTTENDVPSNSIPLALQSLFYKIQYTDTSVSTNDLTKSFGWDTHDAFVQHDAQELNCVLCEKLEDKMKGTAGEGAIRQLFEGHHMSYVECVNVDFKSTRIESFCDLQLDVKGCTDVYASLEKYVEVENLDGNSKYHAEQYGLQDARKGVLFLDFPPVLHLQLKRFEYDFTRDVMAKINDHYEFPLELDLDRENGRYLSPEADRTVRNLYMLHSVLAHSGGVHGGHYCAFIRPTLTDQWFKFDDERVTKEEVKQALEEQYGGEEELPKVNTELNNTPFRFTKYSNAYMLVYIRQRDKEKVLCNVDEKDIAEHLRVRLNKEQEENERKRREEAEYTIVKVACDDDLAAQIGKDIFFDLVDHAKVRSFRIQERTPFKSFKEEVAKELGVPVECQRFWMWAKRQNHTYRPNRPLTDYEESQSVGFLKKSSNKAYNNADWKLFLEVNRSKDQGILQCPPDRIRKDILLFFKLYDPRKEELWYVGRTFVKAFGKPREIFERLNEMAGFPPHQEIQLYEEIRFEPNVMCEPVGKNMSFKACELEDGDIICFQKTPTPEEISACRYPDVPSFLEYVHNRQVRLKQEQEENERKRKEAAEYTTVKVACDDDLAAQIGKDIFFDLVDHDKVRSFRIRERTPFKSFKEEIAKELGVPVECQRFWMWAKRQNHTYRPNRPLTDHEESQSVGFLKKSSNKAYNADWKLFLEVNRSKDQGIPQCPPDRTRKDILLFFKLYDPRKEEFRYVGRTFVKAFGKPREIFERLNEMAGFPPHQEIQLYEEIRFEPIVMCEPVDKNMSFNACLLEDGDIICFQKTPTPEVISVCCYPDVPSFLEYVRNRQIVHFRRLEAPKEEGFFLELSKQHTYNDVVEKVACELGVDDPSKIRLTVHNCYSEEPELQPINHCCVERLSDMLGHYTQIPFTELSYILYFEVLDIPLPELQGILVEYQPPKTEYHWRCDQ